MRISFLGAAAAAISALQAVVYAGTEKEFFYCSLGVAPKWGIEATTAWLFGVNNPRDYHVAPQLVSLVYLTPLRWEFGNVQVFTEVLFGALIEPVLHGPETLNAG